MFEHPIEQAIVVAIFTLLFRWFYDVIFKKDYVKISDCKTIRDLCTKDKEMIKQDRDEQFKEGGEEMDSLRAEVGKVRELLGVMFSLELQLCREANIDTAEIMKGLVGKGLI